MVGGNDEQVAALSRSASMGLGSGFGKVAFVSSSFFSTGGVSIRFDRTCLVDRDCSESYWPEERTGDNKWDTPRGAGTMVAQIIVLQ